MRIRHILIERFRGIRRLDWTVHGTTLCLVGPGDSCKSTILDAIDYALAPRRNASFSDLDFYRGNTSDGFEITVTVADAPRELLSDLKFGLLQRAWSTTKGAHDAPTDDEEHVLSIRLRVDGSLEPSWSVFKGDPPDEKTLTWADRERFGIARLGLVIDRHLTWAEGSALARVTGVGERPKAVLVEANRTAREAVRKGELTSLQRAATSAQKVAEALGVKAHGGGYVPELDAASMSDGGGLLALHDDGVPVRRAGLGTRRLVALALQRSVSQSGGIVLIDEVESGLEPHRLRHLLDVTCKESPGEDERKAPQTFLTTHSPIAICELSAADLWVVRCNDGNVLVKRVNADLQNIVRAVPEAFLAGKIVVCEGKTEIGVCMALNTYWRSKLPERPFAHPGAVPVDGGGDQTVTRATRLRELGYAVAILMDSDKQANVTVDGVQVVQWAGNCCIEQRIARDLPWEGLSRLLEAAAEARGEESIVASVCGRLPKPPKDAPALKSALAAFEDAGNSQSEIREAIGKAATPKDSHAAWFKRPDLGEAAGQVIAECMEQLGGTDLLAKLEKLREWIHAE